MNKDIIGHVRIGVSHQANKYDSSTYLRLLQPIPIPSTVWEDVSMEFIEELPKSMGLSVMFMAMDKLSKYAHFMVLAFQYSSLDVALSYLDHVYKLCGPL